MLRSVRAPRTYGPVARASTVAGPRRVGEHRVEDGPQSGPAPPPAPARGQLGETVLTGDRELGGGERHPPGGYGMDLAPGRIIAGGRRALRSRAWRRS